MQTARVILTAILISSCLMVTEIANAGSLKLGQIVRLSSINNFSTATNDGGCSDAIGATIPAGKAFVIYDVRCTVGLGLVPPPNEETFWLGLVDGNSCSGGSVYSATFNSVDGLRDSPTLPRVVEDKLTVRVKRTASLNSGTVQVVCEFTGIFATTFTAP
jgi:hypothetical protein